MRRRKIADATAYLLEMAGDIQGAFRIMLESLSSSIRILSDTMQSDKMADNTKGTCEGAVRLAFRIMLERLSSSIRSLVRALFI